MIKDFLNKLKTINNVPEETYFVTMHVESLYPNIPNLEGIAAAKRAMCKKSSKTVATKVINFLLIKGCAMCNSIQPSVKTKTSML